MTGWIAVAALAAMPLSAARVEPDPFEISPTGVTFDTRGGCKIGFALSNNYTETLKVAATAYLVTAEGTSLGDAHVSFPPAIPGGKSLAEASFYSFTVAGGTCPREVDLRLTPSFCSIEGGGSRVLRNQYCKVTWEFHIGKRQPVQ